LLLLTKTSVEKGKKRRKRRKKGGGDNGCAIMSAENFAHRMEERAKQRETLVTERDVKKGDGDWVTNPEESFERTASPLKPGKKRGKAPRKWAGGINDRR